MKKMTDNEIIKAWEKVLAIGDAPIGEHWQVGITTQLAKDTFDMLKSHKAEIEELTILCDMQDKNMLEQKAEIERLEKHSKEVAENCTQLLRLNDKETNKRFLEAIEVVKSEARKEIIEKIKSKFSHKGKSTKYGEFTWDDVTSYELDNLLKEMEEEE